MKINSLVILLSAVVLLAYTSYAQIIPTGPLLRVELAKYDPFPAEAGNIVTVWIKIENIGLDAAPNLTAELITKYPFSLVNNDPIKSYGRLDGQRSILLEWRLLVDQKSPSGIYVFELKYTIGDTAFSKKSFNITISQSKSIYELSALFVDLEPVAYSGGTSTLSVDIANIASGTAYFVIARAETEIAVIDRNEIFVGTLEPNDFDTADFDLEFRGDLQPGTYPVKIIMKYKDDKNVEHENYNTINVTLVSKSEAVPPQKTDTNAIILYIILLILIIKFVILPIVRHFRKKKH